MTIILSVQKLTKVYPGTPPLTAVNGISFDLKKGEILGLLGPNGSGKTTTIQMLLGTLTMTSGQIDYFGKDFVTNRSESLQNISFASTYTSMPWMLSVEENLITYGYLYGFNHQESRARFEPLLKRFGIEDKKTARVATLSAGQVTRLMIIKAFFIQPKIVLLDEPTASLDPDIAQDICSFLIEQRNQQGVSILFTSHKMQEVMEVCDRTIFLKLGNVIADDLPEKLARSVSKFHLKLTIVDGLKRTVAIAENSHHLYSLDHRCIEIMLDEDKIPPFLHALSDAKVVYSSIRIEEPSLENFFLQIVKQ